MANIVLIPARGGSKGIKKKNITPVLGKPLIYYTAFSAQKAKNTDKIVVATEDMEIKNIVENFGFDKLEVYERLKKNARNNSKTIDLILEYADRLKQEDTLILVQATSPLTTAEDIDEAINEYNNSNCDSMFSCTRADGFFWDEKGNPILHDKNNRKTRQEYISPVLKENGAIYINKIKNIVDNKSLLSGTIKPFIMDKSKSTEIDEPEDIYLTEKLLKENLYKDINFSSFKIFLSDCDGTLTDGGMYYSKTGELMKKFNTKDGYAFNELKKKGIIVGIITGENNDIVKKRAEKLKIEELYMGVEDKLSVIKELAKKYKIELSNIIYIGDDMNDYEVIKEVGFGCATANADPEVKKAAKYVTKTPGGLGAVREVANLFISKI